MPLERREQTRIQTWAAAHLGVDADVPREKLDLAFLERLAGAGFVPDPMTCGAYQLLVQKEGDSQHVDRVRSEAARAAERQLHEEIAIFRQEFWNLAIAESTLRWQALQAQSAEFPRARAQLQLFLPILGIGTPQPPGSQHSVRYLIEKMQELMVSLPHRRPILRQRFLVELEGRQEYVRAAELLLLNYPDFANQEEAFLQGIQKPLKNVQLRSGSYLPAGPVRSRASNRSLDFYLRSAFWQILRFSWILIIALGALARMSSSSHMEQNSNRYDSPEIKFVDTGTETDLEKMRKQKWLLDYGINPSELKSKMDKLQRAKEGK